MLQTIEIVLDDEILRAVEMESILIHLSVEELCGQIISHYITGSDIRNGAGESIELTIHLADIIKLVSRHFEDPGRYKFFNDVFILCPNCYASLSVEAIMKNKCNICQAICKNPIHIF